MKPTDQTLGEQIKITEREIRRRKELLNLTDEDATVLREAKPEIAKVAEQIVEDFYLRQVEIPEVARIIGDAETLKRLKKHLCRYILTLFDGEYDMEYTLSRLRIGLVHKRIGVPPKLYIPSFRNLFALIRKRLITKETNGCAACNARLTALEKILLFDLELVFDTYIHSLVDELERGKEELAAYAEGLEETVAQRTKELAQLARRDGLTQLLNQRSFYEELRREVARTLRMEENISLIYFDLDGFKAVNDSQGHRRGDEILEGVAQVVRGLVRAEDTAARYGGDEFCIILPHSNEDDARHVAQRLIEDFDRLQADSGVTLSIGIASGTYETLLDGDSLVKQADAAMYRAKKIKGHAIVGANESL